MTEIVRNIYLLSKIVRIDSVNNLKLRSHIYHHNIRNTTLHTIFHVLFLFICLNFSNKSKIKCETNAAAISGGMSHTMFPVIFVSILLYNLQKMFFSTFQQISMSNSHRTSCEFLKDIFGRIRGRIRGQDGRRHAYWIQHLHLILKSYFIFTSFGVKCLILFSQIILIIYV